MADIDKIIPVLPSSDIERDANWYDVYMGFKMIRGDNMYAIFKRDEHYLHLQWHADTKDDPLLGGSVIRIFVDDIKRFAEEFIDRGTITPDKIRMNTPWGTHEFGFYDPNGNGIFIVQSV